MKTILFTLATLFITVKSIGQGRRPNPPCTDCGALIISGSGGGQIPPTKNFNPIFALFIGQNKNNYSQFIGLKYNQTAFLKDTRTYEYKTISLPILIQANLNPYISIGGGVEGNYLLGAKINERIINKNETKQTGLGLIADAEFGFPNRGPRLGVSYTRRFNSGVVNTSNYGFLDLTLRVQIWNKKKNK